MQSEILIKEFEKETWNTPNSSSISLYCCLEWETSSEAVSVTCWDALCQAQNMLFISK